MADKDTEMKDAAEEKGGDKKAAAGKAAGKKAATKKATAKKASGKKAGRKGGSEGAVSVAGNARAAAKVKRAKGWGGIAGFAIAAYLGYKAQVPPDQLGLRALAVGVAGYMLAWACAVAIWRHILMAELRMAVETKRPEPSPTRTIPAEPEPAPIQAAAVQAAVPQPVEATE